MTNRVKETGYVLIVDKDHQPVVLDNKKVYTSISNNVIERAKHLDYNFRLFREGKRMSKDFRCSVEIKKAIELNGGELFAIPIKTFSYDDAKRYASRMNNPYRLAVA